jgi:signal transduction histidine kinase
MTFRTRLLIIFLLTVLLPIVALAFFIRGEMTKRLTGQYERRVESLVRVIEGDLAEESTAITNSIAVIQDAMFDDNRFRRAAVDRAAEDRRYLLDYAGEAMRLAGLSMLQIQDDSGRIISSGHFRNEYDRLETELPMLLASASRGAALVEARSPDEPFLALAGVDSLRIGGRPFTIVAGVKVGGYFLARLAGEAGLAVELTYPGGRLTSEESRQELDVPRVDAGPAPDSLIVRELDAPFVDSKRGELVSATFRVTHDLTELHALRSSVDRWFLVAVVATGFLAIIIVSWLTSRISRPLAELADKTSRIDLDRLDIDFDTRRKDEIGMLSRMLGAMTERLRASATLVKDAERRATLGEMARQVNHDIKNGLTPIRNIFRHLVELAGENPMELPDVLDERRSTLDSSITYLENLASNYARLSPRSERKPCDVNEIVERVVRDLQGSGRASLHMELGGRGIILGDPLSLRRILENLIDNAIDSLESGPGPVTVSTAVVADTADGRRVLITVADTGRGMNEKQRAKIFDDFYTTKENGTGLGLSIVRRLVMDLDGSVAVTSEPGKGSRFVIDLPVVRSEVDSNKN